MIPAVVVGLPRCCPALRIETGAKKLDDGLSRYARMKNVSSSIGINRQLGCETGTGCAKCQPTDWN